MNSLKTWFLMGVLTVLLVLLGRWVGGPSGALMFLILAVAMNFVGYFFSDSIALHMSGARELPESEAPQLHAMIRRLADRAGLPMPRVYITPSPQPNAFATGRNPQHAAVAVTEGILRLLTPHELEGVLAHELAHVRNRDILISSMAAMLAGAITWIANAIQWGAMFGGFGRQDDEEGPGLLGGLFMAILAPIAATLIQLAISRAREFKADATGARIAGTPDGLASALLKLEAAAQQIPSFVNPSTAHMYIVNPLKGSTIAGLFSTHPPIEERVRRLRALHI
ncbi:protease HtpX [Kyrpidia spormannii]|uniref:Protease HtpX homolog n=1 Tax=Kyrpidia spormannii TaxID=2055160 RepID=A0A2K8N858_9BACL|nr:MULTISPECIES: zinc metalloprotease HtpX [Kyrpidia]ATY85518.1 protease HtpX [Kyrpidia spormannii]MCL6574913.1 zinc metalloprotease HtpX [Kyrpidia sp.]HHY68296.1 zinc metalloprotease HtpX [Alicyclobacillus sp.]